MSLKPILYAEDEENDAFFLKRAFAQAGVCHPLIVVPDGQHAIDYCATVEPSPERPLPCLVLLDLNMPRKSGLDVLTWIRKESPVSTLPVIVLTSSLQDADIHRAYSHGANAYLVKPSQPGELVTMVRAIKDFWLTQNRLAVGGGAFPLAM
jgi:CheY-like chemotaxis protein